MTECFDFDLGLTVRQFAGGRFPWLRVQIGKLRNVPRVLEPTKFNRGLDCRVPVFHLLVWGETLDEAKTRWAARVTPEGAGGD